MRNSKRVSRAAPDGIEKMTSSYRKMSGHWSPEQQTPRDISTIVDANLLLKTDCFTLSLRRITSQTESGTKYF